MSPVAIFQTHLVLGYVAWLLCFGTYIWPKLKAMNDFEAQRAIAPLHSFRFCGLVFILPGVVSPNLPASFASFAAYWDFATGVLAMLALLTARIRPLFWLFVVTFNLTGFVELLPRRPGRACHTGGGIRRRLRDSHHLRAAAHHHARRRVLCVAASTDQQVVGRRPEMPDLMGAVAGTVADGSRTSFVQACLAAGERVGYDPKARASRR
jgi:hypothetical protein